MSAPKDEIPPPTYNTPSAAKTTYVDARFIDIGDDAIAVVMSVNAWAVMLDIMHAAAVPDSDLDTIYRGFKHGLGFRAPEELMGPKRPEIES